MPRDPIGQLARPVPNRQALPSATARRVAVGHHAVRIRCRGARVATPTGAGYTHASAGEQSGLASG